MQCGQDLAWPQYYPPFPESTFQHYLKRSVRKDFSFPDHWHMFAQIYFEGISSTLLSFLPKELEEYFKTTFIFSLSLSLCSPYFLSLLLCPSFFLDLLEFGMDFICHGMEKALGAQDLLHCIADPWLS